MKKQTKKARPKKQAQPVKAKKPQAQKPKKAKPEARLTEIDKAIAEVVEAHNIITKCVRSTMALLRKNKEKIEAHLKENPVETPEKETTTPQGK